jgi:hypothetical protein
MCSQFREGSAFGAAFSGFQRIGKPKSAHRVGIIVNTPVPGSRSRKGKAPDEAHTTRSGLGPIDACDLLPDHPEGLDSQCLRMENESRVPEGVHDEHHRWNVDGNLADCQTTLD